MNYMENTQENTQKVTVYYDGLCRLCSSEINHYISAKGADKIVFKDITSQQFNAKAEQVDEFLVHKIMHVKSASGELKTRVDAFIEIWETLPNYRWAAKVIRTPGIKSLAEVGYDVFAFVRPYLPRKKALNCDASPFCETKESK